MPDLPARLRALRAKTTGPLRDALDVRQDGVDVRHLREDDLDQLIHFLSNGMDWGSDGLGFDPHGELLIVSFLGDETGCEHAPFIGAHGLPTLPRSPLTPS